MVCSLVHMWYDNNSAFGSRLQDIARAVHVIIKQGPACEYFQEASKLLLIFSLEVTGEDLSVLGDLSFQRTDRHRYLGGT